MTYDAQSIKVLSEDELDVFPWHMIETLSEKYKAPLECVKRAVEVCFTTGVDVSYYEERYLKNDRSIPVNETFSEAYKESLEKRRYLQWVQKNC